MPDDDGASSARSSMDTTSEEDEQPMDSLIQGRARRSNAGRNMAALLDAEADDDLALLFAEIDDDNEFSVEAEGGGDTAADVMDDDDDDEDMRLESSSEDDDDQGPNAQDDDMEGEKELEKQTKTERKKRKAQEGLRLQALRKKIKTGPTTADSSATTASTADPTPRQRKKSERISWLPTPEEGPTRSSSRRQTMQNKQITHARLKDSEEKRVKLIASMEEAARRKAQHKPKEMTQEERLAEAERVERLNSKSLNRWEEMEKKKAEERRLKLEALQNRRLEGPVMSWWSGIATWTNNVLTRLGKVDVTAKPKEDAARKRSKKAEKDAKRGSVQASAEQSVTVSSTAPKHSGTGELKEGSEDQQTPHVDVPKDKLEDSTSHNPAPIQGETKAADPSEKATDKPTTPIPSHSIHQESNKEIEPTKDIPDNDISMQEAEDMKESRSDPAAKDGQLNDKVEGSEPPVDGNPPTTNEQPGTKPPTITQENRQEKPANEITPASDQSKTNPTSHTEKIDTKQSDTQQPEATELEQQQQQQQHQEQTTLDGNKAEPVPDPGPDPEHKIETHKPSEPPKIEQTGRNLIVLDNFDEKTAQSRDYSIYFNAKKPPRLSSKLKLNISNISNIHTYI